MFKSNNQKDNLSQKQIKNDKQKAKNFRLTNTINISKKTRIILITSFIFIATIVIGNYHIVLNATDPMRAFIFIKRPYFSFTDILGDINACTVAPYYSVMSNHPSLCKALQNVGYLESEKARNNRIQQEIEQEFNKSFSETSECLRRCESKQSNINNYSRCLDNCYLK